MGTYRSAEEVTVAELRDLVLRFTEARGWTSAHDGKNLAMSIAIEAAELMEHFQWGERSEYTRETIAEDKRHEIAMEAADVMIYLLSFSRAMGIDLADAVQAKMEKNETRFPVKPL